MESERFCCADRLKMIRGPRCAWPVPSITCSRFSAMTGPLCLTRDTRRPAAVRPRRLPPTLRLQSETSNKLPELACGYATSAEARQAWLAGLLDGGRVAGQDLAEDGWPVADTTMARAAGGCQGTADGGPWSGTNAATRRKPSWAQRMSSPPASAWAPESSRAGKPERSRCSESWASRSSTGHCDLGRASRAGTAGLWQASRPRVHRCPGTVSGLAPARGQHQGQGR